MAADTAWPICLRSGACRSGANTLSVPSKPSILIAVVMSAAVHRFRKSAIAIINIPSIPSVPLINARPSFACNSIGVIPAFFIAIAESTIFPSLSCTLPSPIMASAQ